MNVIKINPESTNPYCVFGVAYTEAGREIEKEMRAWLEPNYNLIEIWHDGSLFEYPALRYMQDLCKETGKSCLYIHSRGAYNFHSGTTIRTRKMWRVEYGDNRDKYFDIVNTDSPTVACPFTGDKKCTWYNGFVVNTAAMCAIDDIEPNTDRMVFERLFCGSIVNVVGTLVNVPDCGGEESIKAARRYLKSNYNNTI